MSEPNPAQTTAAANRDVSGDKSGHLQDCSDVVHISVFFDGTGNNKQADEEPKKWSNVARTWESADIFRKNDRSCYAIYISGVGTRFTGKDGLAIGGKVAVTLEDSSIKGEGAGAGGTRRLNFGQQRINDNLRDALLAKAKVAGGKIATDAKEAKAKGFGDVNTALGKHRLIKQINVSIFGFSRGAALARAFCNEWLWDCKTDHGELMYEGYPIRFVMLGLFDTVASFGLPATNSANVTSFRGRDMVVDERVERCVHFVAAHEQRFAFPVDLIRKDGKLASKYTEKTYPGVHSDVGGGYKPEDQGIKDNYSRVPMRDMMNEAVTAGSRIYTTKAIAELREKLFTERFEVLPETERLTKAYKTVCKPSGTIEAQMTAHMKMLYSAYGTMHRQGIESVGQRVRREDKWTRIGPQHMADEVKAYRKALKTFKDTSARGVAEKIITPSYVVSQGVYAMTIQPEQWQLDAFDANCDKDVMDFVNQFVHDSKAGFLSNIEPFTYFSKRGVDESTHSVQGWYEESIARPVEKAAEQITDAAKAAAKKAEEAIEEAKKEAERKIEAFKKEAARKYNELKKARDELIDQGIKKKNELLDAGAKKVNSVMQTIENGVLQLLNR
jgi:Uncharacterized alpha/beta hydrolase domain (DUF2235)